MLININEVSVGDRIRKDMGNLDELAEDIKKNGLINPPVVTPEYELIAGERRLQAMKNLGYEQVEVRVMKVEDVEHKLNLEINENENRKDFNKSERIEYARQLERIERVKAKERMGQGVENFPQHEEGKTRDFVAGKLGIGSGKQYEKEKYIADNANEDILKAWNEEKISTHKAYTRVKELEKQLKEQTEINESLSDELMDLRDKEPEVVEKEVIKEVTPDDYEDLKERVKDLREKQKDLENKLFVEKEAKKRAVSQLEEEEQKEKLIKEINSFAWTINSFFKNVGGLLYLTEFLNEVPTSSKNLFIKSANSINGWTTQLMKNIEDNN